MATMSRMSLGKATRAPAARGASKVSRFCCRLMYVRYFVTYSFAFAKYVHYKICRVVALLI